jgi:hypothetical protein
MRSSAVTMSSEGPFRRGPCTHRLDLETDRSRPEIIYGILRELALYKPRETLCQSRDTVRAILPSEIYAEVVRYSEIEGLIDLFPAERAALRELLLEEKIRELALAIVVLKLHAGSFTTESAVHYLEETLGLEGEEAASHVTQASYAPTIAYPGIAILELDRLLKRATVRQSNVRADDRLRQTLMDRYFMSIKDIYANLPSE